MGELPFSPDTLVQKRESAGPPPPLPPAPPRAAENAAALRYETGLLLGCVRGLDRTLQGQARQRG
jgi:hypothetical protein